MHETSEDEELLAALADLPQRSLPADHVDRIRGRLTRTARPRWHLLLPILMAAAALVAMVAGAGWWHERDLRLRETQHMEQQLAAALQSLSAGTRLQAIRATVNSDERGNGIENALITALASDPSASVRMAAAEALGRVARPAVLRRAVAAALAKEQSPFVQMTLLAASDRLPIAEQREVLSPLLTRNDIEVAVASEARGRIQELAKGGSR